MFEPAEIDALLDGAARDRVYALDVLAEIDSTNSYLLALDAPPPRRCRVALTDNQTAGRGRRGRHWLSAPGASICLSLAYTFGSSPTALASATLPVGVAVVRALERAGIVAARLKWPNDVVIRDGKLGGILTEVHSAGSNPSIVVGIGLNVDLRLLADPGLTAPGIGAVRDIVTEATGAPPASTRVAALLIEEVLDALLRFEADGLAPFIDSWRRLDWLRGRRVRIDAGERQLDGVCEGIDMDGALLLGSGATRTRILSGSVQALANGGKVA